jgi:crossover junction endodeoxyribonuclease RuvC
MDGRSDPSLLCAGLIHTPAADALPLRLENVFKEVRAIIAAHKPGEMAIEGMFFAKRSASVAATVQARGVILLAGQLEKLPITVYDPRRVKMTLTGNGAAEKPQMQRMIQLLLKLKKPLQPDDVADAAAIAVCHGKSAPYNALVRAAARQAVKIK